MPPRFYWVRKIEKPPTVWCGDRDFSPVQQLDIHWDDSIVHCPSCGVGIVIGNHSSTFVEVAINLSLRTVAFDKSDGMFEVFRAIKWLRWVRDEISELIVIAKVTDSSPSRGMFVNYRIFLFHRSFPAVSHHHIEFLWLRMWLRQVTVEAIVYRVCFP
jgi:hypothetical protein